MKKRTHFLLIFLTNLLGLTAVRATTFTVTNTNDSGAGSLRQAILDANANAGADLITFNIPGAGPYNIDLVPSGPFNFGITDAVTIDGSTQPGWVNDPIISIGRNIGASWIFDIEANNVTLKYLDVSRVGSPGGTANGHGIIVFQFSNVTIQNCFVKGRNQGIYFQDSQNIVCQDNSLVNSGLSDDFAFHIQHVSGTMSVSGNTFGGTSTRGVYLTNMTTAYSIKASGGNINLPANCGIKQVKDYPLAIFGSQNLVIDGLDLGSTSTSTASGVGIEIWNGVNTIVQNCITNYRASGILFSGGTATLTCNNIKNSGNGILVINSPQLATGLLTANNNSIWQNGTGIFNQHTSPIDATNNWWGSAAGPGAGGNNGTSGPNITTAPFATVVPGCVPPILCDPINFSLALAPVLCMGKTKITVNPPTGGITPYTYQLNNGNFQTPNFWFVTTSGNYTVTVKDATGCTAVPQAIAVTVTPALAVTLTKTKPLCHGQSNGTATANPTGGTPPYSFVWKQGTNIIGTLQTIGGLPAASGYKLSVTDALGCTKSLNFSITQPAVLVLNISSKTPQGTNFKVVLSAPGGTTPKMYRRCDPAGNNCFPTTGTGWQPSPTFNNTPPGNYQFQVKDANNCTASANTAVPKPAANDREAGISIETTGFQTTVSLTPNPFSGQLRLVRTDGFPENLSVKIYDLNGRPVGGQDWPEDLEKLEMPTERLAAGVYFIKILDENGMSRETLRAVKL